MWNSIFCEQHYIDKCSVHLFLKGEPRWKILEKGRRIELKFWDNNNHDGKIKPNKSVYKIFFKNWIKKGLSVIEPMYKN